MATVSQDKSHLINKKLYFICCYVVFVVFILSPPGSSAPSDQALGFQQFGAIFAHFFIVAIAVFTVWLPVRNPQSTAGCLTMHCSLFESRFLSKQALILFII